MSIQMSLQEAAFAMDAKLVGNTQSFSGVSTDSRIHCINTLFFALRGDNFDGHDFLKTAQENGALAAVVDEEGALRAPDNFPLLIVDDTRLALGRLAAHWRANFNLPLIAVTGSNGKTTTKEMVASILKASFGENVLATEGNFNNDIGLPLTLLKLNATHQAAVIEMGMNHPGEIAYLSAICRPTVAVITNVQRAHFEGLGNLSAVAKEKGSIFEGLVASGTAIIPANEPWDELWQQSAGNHPLVRFSLDHSANIQGTLRTQGFASTLRLQFGDLSVDVLLSVLGKHNANNALAATAATLSAGLSLQEIVKGLARFEGVPGRLQKKHAYNGALIIDDTYNANPDSVRAAIDVLAQTAHKKILVFGDMGEIGAMSAEFHDEIGAYAKICGIDRLFTLGQASVIASRNFAEGATHFHDIEPLIAALKKELTQEATVLIKGSRFMRMERVVAALLHTSNLGAESKVS